MFRFTRLRTTTSGVLRRFRSPVWWAIHPGGEPEVCRKPDLELRNVRPQSVLPLEMGCSIRPCSQDGQTVPCHPPHSGGWGEEACPELPSVVDVLGCPDCHENEPNISESCRWRRSVKVINRLLRGTNQSLHVITPDCSHTLVYSWTSLQHHPW